MWSGPRTVSTAMMRAWENRPDTVVIDEPLYAFYLSSTGLDHPGRDEVIIALSKSMRPVTRLSRGSTKMLGSQRSQWIRTGLATSARAQKCGVADANASAGKSMS